jgi:hypothetical protein
MKAHEAYYMGVCEIVRRVYIASADNIMRRHALMLRHARIATRFRHEVLVPLRLADTLLLKTILLVPTGTGGNIRFAFRIQASSILRE